MDSCVFCKIVKGKIPCEKVYEDKDTFAFLDISPVNPGHMIVIPKKHFETLLDIDDDSLAKLGSTIKKMSASMMSALKKEGVEGFNIEINNYPVAGQIVPHLHVHIIPRTKSDDLEHWGRKNYKDGESKSLAEKIRKAL